MRKNNKIQLQCIVGDTLITGRGTFNEEDVAPIDFANHLIDMLLKTKSKFKLSTKEV